MTLLPVYDVGGWVIFKILFCVLKGENYMINMFDLFALTFSGVALTSDGCSVCVCLSQVE